MLIKKKKKLYSYGKKETDGQMKIQFKAKTSSGKVKVYYIQYCTINGLRYLRFRYLEMLKCTDEDDK